MIKVTTFDQREIALNPDLLEKVESVPETVLTLTNGKKLLVIETMAQVVERFILYQRQIRSHAETFSGEIGNEEKI